MFSLTVTGKIKSSTFPTKHRYFILGKLYIMLFVDPNSGRKQGNLKETKTKIS